MSKPTEILVVLNPWRAVAFVLQDGIVVGVTTGTTESYIGKDLEYVKLAMSSVLRFRYDGAEEGSCDGYPDFIRLRMDAATGRTEAFDLNDKPRELFAMLVEQAMDSLDRARKP